MRRLSAALGVVAVCALISSASAFAFGEFEASRLPKPCSEEAPCKTKGKSVEYPAEKLTGTWNQKFIFGPFEIKCAATTHANTIEEGAISWSLHPTFSTEVLFTKCLTVAKYGNGFTGGTATAFDKNPETKKTEPMKIVFKQNGTTEFGVEEEPGEAGEAEIGSGNASFTIGGKVCKINWPTQKVPFKSVETTEYAYVKYSTEEVAAPEKATKQFPSGKQKRLIIFSHLTKMMWNDESGQCLGEGGFEEEASRTEGTDGKYFGALEEYIQSGNLGFN